MVGKGACERVYWPPNPVVATPFNDLTLKEEEHHNQRQRGQKRLRHGLRVLDTVCTHHCLQTHREGHQERVIDDKERPEKVVPRLDEHEDRHGTQNRPRQRQNDGPEDSQSAGPVHPGGIFQFDRYGIKELLKDEDDRGHDDLRQDQTPVGVHHVEGEHLVVERDDQRLRRHDDGGDHRDEQHLLTGKGQARKRISGKS